MTWDFAASTQGKRIMPSIDNDFLILCNILMTTLAVQDSRRMDLNVSLRAEHFALLH